MSAERIQTMLPKIAELVEVIAEFESMNQSLRERLKLNPGAREEIQRRLRLNEQTVISLQSCLRAKHEELKMAVERGFATT